jgi:hypothetical protein
MSRCACQTRRTQRTARLHRPDCTGQLLPPRIEANNAHPTRSIRCHQITKPETLRTTNPDQPRHHEVRHPRTYGTPRNGRHHMEQYPTPRPTSSSPKLSLQSHVRRPMNWGLLVEDPNLRTPCKLHPLPQRTRNARPYPDRMCPPCHSPYLEPRQTKVAGRRTQLAQDTPRSHPGLWKHPTKPRQRQRSHHRQKVRHRPPQTNSAL